MLSGNLSHWLIKIESLIDTFTEISFRNVFKELNSQADVLSKAVVGHMDGLLHYEESISSNLINSRCVSIF